MQTAIVVVIVALAAFYLIRRFYNSVSANKQDSSSCSCGCDGCSPAQKDNCTTDRAPIEIK